MTEIIRERRLAKFPNLTTSEEMLTTSNCISYLRLPRKQGMLIHGSPSSGKSTLLRIFKEDLSQESDVYVYFQSMSRYRGQSNPEFLFRDLIYTFILAVRTEFSEISLGDMPLRELDTPAVESWVINVFDSLQKLGKLRIILLLDDFDTIHPAALIMMGEHLRKLHETCKEVFNFVLTSTTDLAELYQADHIYSPLRNVTELLLLKGLDRHQTRQLANRLAAELDLKLELDVYEDLPHLTGGHPVLIDTLLRLIHERPNDGLEGAKLTLCQKYYRFEPFRSMTRMLEDFKISRNGPNPIQVLYDLVLGTTFPSPEDGGTRMLLALGMLDWRGTQLTWANQTIQTFWEETGKKLLERWLGRYFSFAKGELSAQGTVYVNFLMDLNPFLIGGQDYDHLRGSTQWVKLLKRHKNEIQNGSFHLWAEQKNLFNLAHDLNMIRMQIIENSLTPIYQATANDLKLSFTERLQQLYPSDLNKQEEGERILYREWARWHRVQIHLTRGGAVIITLIQEIQYPIPLMHIMDNLLGLDQELPNDDGFIDLTVQGELSMAILDIFFHQVGKEWLSPWEFHIPSVEKERPLYTERDRYVIYQFSKLCNCRPGPELRRPDERKIVRVQDLEPIRENKNEKLTQEAYELGRELAGILEGVMIAQSGAQNGESIFPPIKREVVIGLLDSDLSSWENELFTISLDNALILYTATKRLENLDQKSHEEGLQVTNDSSITNRKKQEIDNENISFPSYPLRPGVYRCHSCHEEQQQIFDQLYFPSGIVPYENYWRCVRLGIQYLLELRWVAKWVASRASHTLEKMADLMERAYPRDQQKIDSLTDVLPLYTRLLSHLREATVPLSIATADYASYKFEHFIELNHLRRIIENGEKDIADIRTFLQHHEDQRDSVRQEKVNRLFAWGGGILAALAIIVGLPSLWIDFEGSFLWRIIYPQESVESFPPGLLQWVLGIITFIIIVLLILLCFWIIRTIKDLSQMKGQTTPKGKSQ